VGLEVYSSDDVPLFTIAFQAGEVKTKSELKKSRKGGGKTNVMSIR
jgi:hypothetical protein